MISVSDEAGWFEYVVVDHLFPSAGLRSAGDETASRNGCVP